MSEAVDHPKHYTSHPSGVEAIEIIRHMSCNLANAFKYVARAGIKYPDRKIEDLEKAAWYLRDFIKHQHKIIHSIPMAQDFDYILDKYIEEEPVEWRRYYYRKLGKAAVDNKARPHAECAFDTLEAHIANGVGLCQPQTNE